SDTCAGGPAWTVEAFGGAASPERPCGWTKSPRHRAAEADAAERETGDCLQILHRPRPPSPGIRWPGPVAAASALGAIFLETGPCPESGLERARPRSPILWANTASPRADRPGRRSTRRQ